MSRTDLFRERCAYTEWANNRMLEFAAGLGDDELVAPRESTAYGSLAKDFQHLIDAQNWWESVLRGAPSATGDTGAPDTDAVAILRGRFAESHAALKRLCDSMTEELLDGVATYRGREGYEPAFPRWQMMEHVFGHGSQHRGEIGMILHRLDRSPGDMDFLDYIEATEDKR